MYDKTVTDGHHWRSYTPAPIRDKRSGPNYTEAVWELATEEDLRNA